MDRNIKKVLVALTILLALVTVFTCINAVTLKETTSKDSYDTIEEGTIIIGRTKFTPDTIITAARAALAGANDMRIYIANGGKAEEYTSPVIYIYAAKNDWYSVNESGTPVSITAVTSLDIYFVNNEAKTGTDSVTNETIEIPAVETNKYSVTFMNGTDVISSEAVEEGTEVAIPSGPSKEGYTFAGWADANGKAVSGSKVIVTKNTVIFANFTANDYKVADYSVKAEYLDLYNIIKAEKSTYKYGDTVVLTIEPVDGYSFDATKGITIKGVDKVTKVAENNNNTYTFTMPASNIKASDISATFNATGYALEIFDEYLTADKSSYIVGETVTLTVGEIPAGYKLEGINYDYDDGTALGEVKTAAKQADGKYTFTMPNKNVSVWADAQLISYTVKFVDDNGETVLYTNDFYYGTTPTYSGVEPTKVADARYTYTFAGWTPTIAEVTGDATYTATYSSEVNNYTVKLNATYTTVAVKDGTDDVTINNNQFTAEGGKTYILTIEPKTANGYELSSVKVNGIEVKDDTTNYSFDPDTKVAIYKLTNITADTTVDVVSVFRYTVTDKTEGAKATTNVAANYLAGEEVTVTVTPKTDTPYTYVCKGLTVTLTNGTAVPVTSNEDGTYTFTMPANNIIVTALIDEVDYNITVSTTGVGTVVFTNNVDEDTVADVTTYTANSGKVVTLKVSANANPKYDISGVSVTYGEAIAVVDLTRTESDASGDTYTFTMPKSEISVAVTFVQHPYGITVTPPEKGTLTVKVGDNDATRELADTELNITATPINSDYILEKITITDSTGTTELTENGIYTMIESDVSISATFAYLYNVSISNVEGITLKMRKGTDSAENASAQPLKAIYGETIVVTAEAADGYTLTGIQAKYTNDVVYKSSSTGTLEFTINGRDIVVVATTTPITFDIALNNANATTDGTATIYEVYGTDIYLDSGKTNAMTADVNPIILPSRIYTVAYEANSGSVTPVAANTTSTYVFKGYYDEETQMINGTGYITENFTNKKYTQEKTLNAEWESATVTLPAPTRTGYTFEGWYTDNVTFDNKVGNAGETYTPTEDVTLYANWTSNEYTLTIEHYLENANDTEYTLSTTTNDTVRYDTVVTLADKKTTIENGIYLEGKVSSDVVQTTVTMIEETTIKLYYTRNTKTLTLVSGEGINSVTGAATYKVGATVTLSATLIDGYQTLAWTETTSGVEDEDKVTVTEGTFAMPARDTEITASASAIRYTLAYTLDGGSLTEGSENPEEYYVTSNDIILKNPSKVGYSFAGWTGTGLDGATTLVTITNGSIGDRNYSATWIANTDTQFSVKYWKQKLNAESAEQNSDNYEVDETATVILQGTTATAVSGTTLKVFEGFKAVSELDTTTTINADGSTVINYYYTRNSYELTTAKGTGIASVGGDNTYKYGETVNVSATVDTGYDEDSLAWDETTIGVATENKVNVTSGSFTMPARTVELTASAELEKYTLTATAENGTKPTFKVNDGVAPTLTVEDNEVPYANVGNTITVENLTPEAGCALYALTYTYNDGSEHVINIPTTGEEAYKFTMPAYNVEVNADYQMTYGITVNTAVGGTVIPNVVTAFANDMITLTVSDITTGYRLTGLTVKNDRGTSSVALNEAVSASNNTYTFKMPTHDVVVTPTFSNTYTVTLVTGGKNGSSTTLDPIVYGSTLKNDAITTPANYVNGVVTYTYTGRYFELVGEDWTEHTTMPAKDLTLYANFNITSTASEISAEDLTNFSNLAVGPTTIYYNGSNSISLSALNRNNSLLIASTALPVRSLRVAEATPTNVTLPDTVSLVISGKAKLNIGDGTLTMSTSITVNEGAELAVTAGTIENTSSDVIANSGKLIVKGAKLIASSNDATALTNSSTGTVTIDGATLSHKTGTSGYVILNEGKMNIENAKIQSGSSDAVIKNDISSSDEGTKLTLENVTITTSSKTTKVIETSDIDKVTITGETKINETSVTTDKVIIKTAYVDTAEELTTAISDNATEIIILESDITLESVITISSDKDVTIDLNGHTITSKVTGRYAINIQDGGKLNIIGHGNIIANTANLTSDTTKSSASSSYYMISNKGKLSIKGDSSDSILINGYYGVKTAGKVSKNATTTIKNVKIVSYFVGLMPYDYSDVTLDTCTINSLWYCVSGNGTQTGTECTIKNSKLNSVEDVAIYWPSTNKLTISDSEITGYSGIEALVGTINLTNTKINATGSKVENCLKYGDGSIIDGSAILLRSQNGYVGDGTLSLTMDETTWNNLKSTNNKKVRVYEANGTVNDGKGNTKTRTKGVETINIIIPNVENLEESAITTNSITVNLNGNMIN